MQPGYYKTIIALPLWCKNLDIGSFHSLASILSVGFEIGTRLESPLRGGTRPLTSKSRSKDLLRFFVWCTTRIYLSIYLSSLLTLDASSSTFCFAATIIKYSNKLAYDGEQTKAGCDCGRLSSCIWMYSRRSRSVSDVVGCPPYFWAGHTLSIPAPILLWWRVSLWI